MATRSVRPRIVAGALGAAFVLIGSGVGSVALAADHAVDIAGFAFSPATVTVAVGDTVTWTNGDAVNHTATADDASFNTGTIAAGSSRSATFSTAGTFAYHCSIHPAMTATIVVTSSSTPPPTDAVAPAATHSDATPLALLVLAAIGGLFVGRRRFAGSVAAVVDD
jgi:plastocyanin